MEIRKKKNILEIESDSKGIIYFDEETKEVKIGDLIVSYPGEYEKSGILLEVKEYSGELFYSFAVDSKHIFFVLTDNFELKEEIVSFFGDVDVLIIVGTKKSVNIFENIEARVVVPYGETKSIFLQTLGQNREEVSSFKLKGEYSPDNTEFVNLE
ncbi:hypothetical protein BLD25_03515 [Candidatus Gracilibacteria bacterium GN02-872]|nr:hypothetical protein BLD25_03515 [Candidatus Gracilibacteria bacterium GN02-872]